MAIRKVKIIVMQMEVMRIGVVQLDSIKQTKRGLKSFIQTL